LYSDIGGALALRRRGSPAAAFAVGKGQCFRLLDFTFVQRAISGPAKALTFSSTALKPSRVAFSMAVILSCEETEFHVKLSFNL
jgi:hypothetical protein